MFDEHTRECLAIEVARSLTSRDVILTLGRLMRLHGRAAPDRNTLLASARWQDVNQRLRSSFEPPELSLEAGRA